MFWKGSVRWWVRQVQRAVRVESVSGVESDNWLEVRAGVQEMSQVSALDRWPGAPWAWVWPCAVAGTWGPSVGSVPLQTFHPPDFGVRKLLESFLGLTPRVKGGTFPWVTGSWSCGQEQVAAHVCRQRGS